MLGLGILRAQSDTPDAVIRARFYEDLSAGAEQKVFQVFVLRELGDVAFGDDAPRISHPGLFLESSNFASKRLGRFWIGSNEDLLES